MNRQDDTMEMRILKMENQLLKHRLMEVTKNPDYIRPPSQWWAGNEPELISDSSLPISRHVLHLAACVTVDREPFQTHVRVEAVDKDRERFMYAYYVSEDMLQNSMNIWSMCEFLHQKAITALVAEYVKKRIGIEEE